MTVRYNCTSSKEETLFMMPFGSITKGLHARVASFVELRESIQTGEKSLHAVIAFGEGEIFSPFRAQGYLKEPTRLSIQVDEENHILLAPEFLQYMNHSCRPNVFFDLRNGTVVCLRPIAPREEITFFYPSTEWSMVQAFQCLCGSENCLGYIRGAAYVPSDVLENFVLSEHIIRRKAMQNLAASAGRCSR